MSIFWLIEPLLAYGRVDFVSERCQEIAFIMHELTLGSRHLALPPQFGEVGLSLHIASLISI